MSLRGRLLLVIILLNVAVLGVVQVASAVLQRREMHKHNRAYQEFLEAVLADAYSPQLDEGPGRVRRLLETTSIARFFRDVLVTNGLSPHEPGFVDLNLMGAAHRDPDTFPLAAIRDGIQRAMLEDDPVEVGGGFCVPITANRQVVAGVWYRPIVPPWPLLPFPVIAVPVVLSTLLFGVLAFWTIGRSVVRPLRNLGRAAARVGAGDYGVRVANVPRTPELAVLVDAFNAMAEKVAGHTEELQREVERATEETRRKERALLVSSRLAAMGTLAAGIAHEINNPIGGMLNAVHRLAARAGLEEKERVYLELIRDGLERVARTARKVLDFLPRQIAATPFQLAAAVEGARALVEHRLRRQGVELRVDLPADLPPLVGDPHEFQQVLLNFFLNSLDVMEGQKGPCWIAVSARVADGRMHVLVEDNGPGIERALLERVMDPFFSAKGKPDASGLGMFISYSIIRNHEGEMELDSAPGQGFRIRIRMPVR